MAHCFEKKNFSKISGPSIAQLSPLLSLAPELRNRIYEELFRSTVLTIPPCSEANSHGRLEPPGLLLTCKQIHLEAIQVFWATAVFEFPHHAVYRLGTWARNIGSERKSLLHEIRVLPDKYRPGNSSTARRREAEAAQNHIGIVHTIAKFNAGVVKMRIRMALSAPWIWTATPLATYRELNSIRTPKNDWIETA